MNQNEFEEYLKKLKDIEETLGDDDDDNLDTEFINEINNILKKINQEITAPTTDLNFLKINIKKLSENAVIPSYSKDGDAGMDLTATKIISNTTFDVTYGTDLAIELPKGYVGLIFPRSSIRKYDLLLSNSVGVVDSGYRGELQITFKKTNGLDSLSYLIGDRVAQIMIIPHPIVKFNEVSDLSDSERGSGGFGSTGN